MTKAKEKPTPGESPEKLSSREHKKPKRSEPLTSEQQKTVSENIKLAYKFASNVMRGRHIMLRGSCMDFDEVYSLCVEGLIYAAKYYNPEKAKFSTFAYRLMRNTVMRGMDSAYLVRIPDYTKKHREVVIAEAEGREVGSVERPYLDIMEKSLATPVSLSERRDSNIDVPDPSEKNTFRNYDMAIVMHRLYRYVWQLPPRHRDVIFKKVIEKKNYRVIAEEMHISPQRVRDLFDRSVDKLKKIIRENRDKLLLDYNAA